MTDVDGLDRRIRKIEVEKGTHPPLIVWEGQDIPKPKPGQEIIMISWSDPKAEDERK